MYSNFNICNGIYRTSVEDKKTWHQNYLKKSQIFQYLKVKKTTTFFLFWNVKKKVNGSAKFLQSQIFGGLHY